MIRYNPTRSYIYRFWY